MIQEIRILKSAGLLQYFLDGQLRAAHPAQVGRNVQDKRHEGDEATPLGEFFICAKNPRSRFHRSLCLSYPNQWHATRGLREGLIGQLEHDAIQQALEAGQMPPQYTRLGGEIYLHGGAVFGAHGTRGCVAVNNEVIELLFEQIAYGTRVVILP